jgi:hypothetical protein
MGVRTVTTRRGVVNTRFAHYHRPVRTAFIFVLCAALPLRAQERQLVDEVVAVVDAHSITLSELAAETRIRLASLQGPAAAMVPLDRRVLAASLRKTVEERVVLSEVERLKLFDLDRAEGDALVARLRARFATPQDYEAFIRSIELTEDEIGAVLGRELRVGRYLDNRLKLAAQLRDSELEEVTHGKTMSAAERSLLRERLSQDKYQRLLHELLASLRERTTVRILDPLEAPAPPLGSKSPEQPADGGKVAEGKGG